jgi:YVTN family beta-propeller protein
LNTDSEVSSQEIYQNTLNQTIRPIWNLNTDFHIPVGKNPGFIEDVGNAKMYIVNEVSNTISVISTENDTKLKDIPVGDKPHFIATAGDDKVYVANSASKTLSVINTTTDTKLKDIPIEEGPGFLATAGDDKLYVANYDSNTVSVINTTTDTRIGKDIPVGERPVFIKSSSYGTKLYIANQWSNTISVISTTNDTKIGKDIPVGDGPLFLGYMGDVYVANFGSDTVSVIDTTYDTKIKDIPVGTSPTSLFVNFDKGGIYVTNAGSDSISLIDVVNDKVVGRFSFDVLPLRSGNIECGNITAPLNRPFYLDAGIACKAIPNKGFEFLSWEKI